LEARTLLAASTTPVPVAGSPSSYQNSYQYRSYMTAIGALDQYTTVLAKIEHRSKATAAESLALRDDAKASGAAIAAAGVDPKVASAKEATISSLLDSAPIDGWFTDQGWADERTKLDNLVAGLGVSEDLVTRTIADMRALADSAGVSKGEFYRLSVSINAYKSSEHNLSYYYGLNYLNSLPDAHVFYTQHLTGFVQGGKARARADRKQLADDEQALVAASGANATQAGALRGGIHRLQLAEARATSGAIDQLDAAIGSAFAGGAPTVAALSALKAEAGTILANSGAAAIAQADGAISMLATFAHAAQAASTTIDTVLVDAARIVEEGAAGPANPYLVTP
jgi:hypothetical protein